MDSVTIVTAGDCRISTAFVEKAVRDLGSQLIPADEALEKRQVGTLIYLCSEQANLSQWFQFVNLAKRDIAISNDTLPISGWSDYSVSISSISSEAVTREILKGIIDGSSDIDSIRPHIIQPDDEVDSPFCAHGKDELFSLLKDASIRALALPLSLKRTLPERKLKRWDDYVLARFLKGSQTRYFTSILSIRVRLAGSESTSTPNILYKSLIEVVNDKRLSNLFVLRGPPGSGKSVQLQHLEMSLALKHIRSNGSDVLLPFCVNLSEHATGSGGTLPFKWLDERWNLRFDVEGGIGTFEQQLRERPTVILLDGFNEIPFANSEERRHWMNRWKACIHDQLLVYSKTRVIVACRPRDLLIQVGTSDQSCTYLDLEPLGQSEILSVARHKSLSAYKKLKAAFEQDESLVQLYRSPFALTNFLEASDGEVSSTQSEIFWRRIVSRLKRERAIENPAIGSALLPETSVVNLLSASNIRDAVAMMTGVPLFSGLGALALMMADIDSKSGKSRTAIDIREFAKWVQETNKLPQNVDRHQFRSLAEDFLLVIENEGYLKFAHHTLQDFFCVLAMSPSETIDKVRVSPSNFADKLERLDAILPSMGIGDILQVVPNTGFEEVFSRLIEVDNEVAVRAIEANPWLVAETAAKVSDPAMQDRLRQGLRQKLEQCVKNSQDIRASIASLRSLGQIGWGWPKNGHAETPLMIEVPSKTWILGMQKQTMVTLNLANAQPRHEVTLPSYAVSKYPITNAEFKCFYEAGGYSEARYWTEAGWAWRSGSTPVQEIVDRWLERRNRVAKDEGKPLRLLKQRKVSIVEAAAILRFARMTDTEVKEFAAVLVGTEIKRPAFWGMDRYSNPLQPVVGVSFHEATAYCNWLAEKSGLPFRLLSEDEWEASAALSEASEISEVKAIDDIVLPNQWSNVWGNSGELHIGCPTPVGAFNATETTHDKPSDMFGNVFEWVTDPVIPNEDWCLVVKGGSFRHLILRCHPGYRGRGDNTSRNDDNGFRVAYST